MTKSWKILKKKKGERNEMNWKEDIPSRGRRPRRLVKGGKGALLTLTRSPAQFPEIIKNLFFQSLSDELWPFIKLK